MNKIGFLLIATSFCAIVSASEKKPNLVLGSVVIKALTPEEHDWKSAKANFSFDANNVFKPMQTVVVPRSDGTFTLGQITEGQSKAGKNSVLVKVAETDEGDMLKNVSPELIGVIVSKK